MKKFISVILCFCFAISVAVNATATDIIDDTTNYLLEIEENPTVGSVGGEWTILGLARSNRKVPPKYFDDYYKNVEEYVEECNGVLHKRKYSEYSRLIIALTAIGKDPKNVAGYNLLMPLSDYEKTILQGINGAIWALVALDCGNYNIEPNPDAKVQATREMYVDKILSSQLSDGGWSLTLRGESDPDITAMALVALSNYQDNDDVKKATEKALVCMSQKQSEDGGFSSWGITNIESTAQMIVALCELGIDIDDPRFVKNGNTLLDNMSSYYEKGKGFRHTPRGESNLMATEQALYALVAVERVKSGNNSLFDMSDVNSRLVDYSDRTPINNSLIFMLSHLILGECQ